MDTMPKSSDTRKCIGCVSVSWDKNTETCYLTADLDHLGIHQL